MSVEGATTVARPPGNKAPWLSMPGALEKPKLSEYSAKISGLVEQRRALLDELKQLQSTVQNDPERQKCIAERNAFGEELNEIDACRKVQRELRAVQNAKIAKLRKSRTEVTEKLRSVQAEVGGFTTLKEIDEAIDHMMRKMETSGGGLVAERRNQQHLQKLEEAKMHLQKLQPLTEAIKEITEEEVILQQEYLAICEKIGILNGEYEEKLKQKNAKHKEAQEDGAHRAEVYKKCDALRVRIAEISQTVESLRAERDRLSSEWHAWSREARTKYYAQLEQRREQRRKEYEEIRNAHKIAAKRERAAKRQNPYVTEISACATLIQYLKQKKVMLEQEEQERKKREAAAHFDPSQTAPAGCVVLNDSKWADNKTPYKSTTKLPKQQKKQKEKIPQAKAGTTLSDQKERPLHHTDEKIRLFRIIEIEPTRSRVAIDSTISEIESAKKKYESHIQTGELVLSSGEDEEDDEENTVNDDEVPSELAPADAQGVVVDDAKKDIAE